MVLKKQNFKYIYLLEDNMGKIKVIGNDGNEKELTVSTDVEAQVLATRELAKAINTQTARLNK